MAGLGARHEPLRDLRRLARQREARSEQRCFVAEGPTLLADALAAGIVPELVLWSSGAPVALIEQATATGATVLPIDAKQLGSIATTVTPQPVLAALPFVDRPLDTVLAGALARQRPVLVLAGVADPGNAGTLLRSAEAAGVGAVVLTAATVEAYNPKVVRSSAGSLFRVPLAIVDDPTEVILSCRAAGIRLVATGAAAAVAHTDANLTGALAIVLGSEAHGVPPSLADAVDERVAIFMEGRTESLNVAMAGTVLCFEAMRQRAERARHQGSP